MAYYQGDYYQGDYYQGDPFLGTLFAKGISWLGKKIFKRKLTTIGTTELARRTTSQLQRFAPAAAVGAGLVGSQFKVPIPFTPFQMQPGAILPGGQPYISRRQPAAAEMMGACPTGYHLNKARACDGRPAGTYMVRNRSMNVANPRALRRSLRRVAGFGKLAARSRKDIKRAAKAIGA